MDRGTGDADTHHRIPFCHLGKQAMHLNGVINSILICVCKLIKFITYRLFAEIALLQIRFVSVDHTLHIINIVSKHVISIGNEAIDRGMPNGERKSAFYGVQRRNIRVHVNVLQCVWIVGRVEKNGFYSTVSFHRRPRFLLFAINFIL